MTQGVGFSYADDTAAISYGETKEKALEKLEITSTELLKFFASNRLVINTAKTSLLVIRNPRSSETHTHFLKVGDAHVSESDSITLLGIKLSADLSWKDQHDSVAASLRSTNGLFFRLAKFMPNRFMTPLVHGLHLSKVRYGLPLYGSIRASADDPTSASMQQLQVQVNKGLRTVLGVTLKDRKPLSDLVAEVGVPTVNQLTIEMTLMETWRQINHHLPAANSLKFVEDYVAEGRTTRRMGKGFLAPIPKDETGAARFFQKAVRLWNSAPQYIRDEKDENIAKRMIKEYAKGMPL